MASRKVENAIYRQIIAERVYFIGHTVDFVFQFLPVAKRGPFNPVARENQPRKYTERIPSQVKQTSLVVPETFPPIEIRHCCHNAVL